MSKRKTVRKSNALIDRESVAIVDFMLAIDLCPQTLNQMCS